MKLLVLLLVALAVVWMWRRGQRQLRNAHSAGRGDEPRRVPMVRCARCGVHLPGNEAMVGRKGSYCTAAHRQESEGA